jgi:hypothetical protein
MRDSLTVYRMNRGLSRNDEVEIVKGRDKA